MRNSLGSANPFTPSAAGSPTWRRGVLLGGVLVVLAGCSRGGGGSSPPRISPEAADDEALAEYDTNKDGYLEVKELEKCPPLRTHLKDIDSNGDGKISKTELVERMAAFKLARDGEVPLQFNVRLDVFLALLVDLVSPLGRLRLGARSPSRRRLSRLCTRSATAFGS